MSAVMNLIEAVERLGLCNPDAERLHGLAAMARLEVINEPAPGDWASHGERVREVVDEFRAGSVSVSEHMALRQAVHVEPGVDFVPLRVPPRPRCYGSEPNDQEFAENDCSACVHAHDCLKI